VGVVVGKKLDFFGLFPEQIGELMGVKAFLQAFVLLGGFEGAVQRVSFGVVSAFIR